MTNTSSSLSFTQDMALVQMFSKEEVFSTALPMMWKEKITNSKTPTPGKGENRAAKRKLYSPGSNSEDEDKKGTPKRRKDSQAGELSPTGLSKPRTPVTSARLTVRLSERQQMALLMQMTAEKSNQPNDAVLHYPVTPTSPHSAQKRTPSDRKVNKRNERGETPLHLAAIRGDVKAIKKLIKSGVDVNIKDYAGWTPLHEACNHGWMDIAKQLLKAGANVNAQGFEDDLPLHDAAINGHLKLVELLLRHGADPLRQNLKGKSPLDVAANKEIVRLMRSEVVASTSSGSSIADVRSPTSPESNNSDDLDHPKLIDSASEVGLLAVRHRSTPYIRSWDSEIVQSTNHWNGTNVCLSTSPNNAALPVSCALSQSRVDPQPQISTGLSPLQVHSSTVHQAAYSTSTSSTFHSSSSSLAAGVSKKVQVSHYMDRSSSSPRLTLKFRHIKQKDCGNKLVGAKTTAEDAKLTAGPSYCSYRVSINASTEAERIDEKLDNRPAADRFTPVSGINVIPDTRTLWNGGSNAGMWDGAENSDQSRIRGIVVGKSADVGTDANDKSTPFSNQFEDISDAEDDRPSAAKMFSLSQLSQHIPSVSAVYQCHPNSGTIFYDGNGPASMSSLPLLSGLSWSNIGYGGYAAGVAGAISATSGNQFSLPLAADRTQAQLRTTENSAYPWGQGIVPSRSIPSVKVMVPLSIDTDVVGRSQACVPGEKPDSNICTSDLLISMPHSSSAGSTSKPCDKTENYVDEQKYFVKNELPKNDVHQLEVTKSLSKFLSPEKIDADPFAVKIKMSPTEGYKKDSSTESKVASFNRSFDVKTVETCSSESSSRKLDDSAEMELSGRAAMSGTENSAVSSKAVSNSLDCDTLPTDVESKPEIARLTPDLNRIPLSCGQELLENSNLSSGENLNSVLRVPPLKIIIPPKNGAIVDKDILNAKMASSTKSNLPYIVNILQDSMVESSSFDSTSIELLTAKDSGSSTLPEPILAETSWPENSSVDQKDSMMSRKRKFKTSCKGLGKDKDRDAESANGETISNCDSREFVAMKGGLSCFTKDPNDLKPEEKADAKDRQQNQPISGMERRMTRSAMRSQQQKGQQREKHLSVTMETTFGPAKMDASCHMGIDKDGRDNHTELSAGGKSIIGDAVEEEAVYCPRKHKAKHRQLQQQQQQQQQQDQSTVESHIPIAPPQALKRPTNPYEIYMKFKKKVAERKNRLSTLIPKLPATYSNFMMVQCHYNLHKDRTKQDDLKLASPSDLPESLKGLFEEQEQKRHQLRMQHMKEREQLIILAEQETLRVQGRAARALNGHGIGLSASALLCTEEAHCCLDFDQDDKDQRSRYNGRQLKSWVDEIQQKFTNMKTKLLSRHRLEADILHSVQKLDWEWKMKEVGSCDYHSTPAINELLVPTVTVGDNLDLPGT